MTDKKIKMIFDATHLSYMAEKNGMRSAIFFVTKNLLLEFCRNPELDIYLFCDYKRLEYLKKLVKDGNFPENCKILDTEKAVNPFMIFMAKIACVCRKENGKDNFIKKILRFFAFRCFHFFDEHKGISRRLISLFDKYDVYFSPYEPILPEVDRAKIKSYLFLHDAIPLVLDGFYKENNFSRDWFKTLMKSLRAENTYFANSEHTKNDFIKYSPDITSKNIVVAPLGANENFYQEKNIEKIEKIKRKYKIPPDKKYLFSLCNLEPRKNLVFAVKNFIEFIKKNNVEDFIFVIGGGSWVKLVYHLEKYVENFDDFKDKILKIGYVDDEDLPILYSGAEMFVYPSFYEGFGMPILEAMQCGCPVICSNTSSMPEVIGDCGIMIDPKSDEDLISAFEKMYFDETFRNSCHEKGLERAKIFSWKKCADIIIEKIKSDLN
ncbi:glycosyltransferase family 4 protein [bacterium]|nr:glycosyltransferase family 4 protein [bacterium]